MEESKGQDDADVEVLETASTDQLTAGSKPPSAPTPAQRTK